MQKRGVDNTLESQRRSRKLRGQPRTSTGNVAGRRNPEKDGTWVRLGRVLVKVGPRSGAAAWAVAPWAPPEAVKALHHLGEGAWRKDPCLHHYSILFPQNYLPGPRAC